MGLSFLVLILVFRSIMVPLVASVGFLFSVLASFGAVVSIYQLGFMSSLFGVDHPGTVLSFLPTLLIGIPVSYTHLYTAPYQLYSVLRI